MKPALKKITMIVLLLLVPIINATKFHWHVTSFHPEWTEASDKAWLLMLLLLFGALVILGEFRKTIWGKIALVVTPLLMLAGIALWAAQDEEGAVVFCIGAAAGSLLYNIYFFRKKGLTGLAVMKYVFVMVSALTYSSVFYPGTYSTALSWVDFGCAQMLLVVFCVHHLRNDHEQHKPKDPELAENGAQVFRYEEDTKAH